MQTVTPLLPVPVKAVDLVDMSTEYRWALPFAKWVGPYARAQAVTAALPGQLVRNKETQVRRELGDGTTEDETIGLDANGVSVVPLTSFFEPLVINENAGVNVIALEEKWLTLKTRIGAGGQHIIVQNGFVLASSDDTTTTSKTTLVCKLGRCKRRLRSRRCRLERLHRILFSRPLLLSGTHS
ncbi:MAG: hypothetical protein GY822_08940 [Deltaproteobacteria bacterium]|nr:hypothetical protein [Deltaproteobacteria bacterium]